MTTDKLIETLQEFLDNDINCFPLILDKNQKGERVEEVPKWKHYKTKKITEKEIKHLCAKVFPWSKLKANAVAVITGPVSGNLCCLDIDLKNRSKEDKESGKKTMDEALMGLKYSCEGFFDSLLIEKTWSGGLHIFYRTVEPINESVVVLARSSEGKALIESFHHSKIVYTAPTKNYENIQGGVEEIPVLDDSQVADLQIWARSWNQFEEKPTKKLFENTHRKKTNDNLFDKTPWDDYNEKNTPLQIALDRGWKIAEERKSEIILTRPGDDTTNSKSAVYEVDKEILFVLTTSVPELKQFQSYDAFGLYSALEHGGDQRKSWVPLEKQGFGQRNPNAKHKDGKSPWAIFHDYLCFDRGIIRNELSGELEVNGIPVDEETLNSYFIDIKEQHPKAKGVIPQNFWLFIKSNEIQSYHPVKEFLQGNNRRSNVSQIDKLMHCIEPYDSFSMKLLKKWVIGIVANVFNPIHPSIIGPVLYGPPNSGKTTFFERLLPPEFRDYFTIQDAEDKLDGNDAKSKLTQNLLILFDEFRFAKKVDARQFRAFISSSMLDYREPYARKSKKRKRIASWCAATNYPDFINEAENNRRMIPILVELINHELFNSIDKKELFLEAYELFTKGEPYLLDKEEVKQLSLVSKDNEPVTVEEELITKFLKPATPFDVGAKRMTATDVLEYLQRNAGSLKMPYANARNIGRYLKNLGFELKRTKLDGAVHRIYHVVEKANTSLWEDEPMPGEGSSESEVLGEEPPF